MSEAEIKRFYTLVMQMQKEGYRMQTITKDRATFTHGKETVSFDWDGKDLTETGRKRTPGIVEELF